MKWPGAAPNLKAQETARVPWGYDNPMGNFGGAQDTIGQVIGAILAGAMRGRDLDRVLRDNYRYPVPRADPDFGGLWGGTPFPPPWGRSNSWSQNRGSGLENRRQLFRPGRCAA